MITKPLVAKFSFHCAECGKAIDRGEVFFFHKLRDDEQPDKVCTDCGLQLAEKENAS